MNVMKITTLPTHGMLLIFRTPCYFFFNIYKRAFLLSFSDSLADFV